MLPSQSMVLQVLALAGLAVLADPGGRLQVLRVTPANDAAPTASVTITFDRPVAGSLDRTVDPGRLFKPGGPRVEPCPPRAIRLR